MHRLHFGLALLTLLSIAPSTHAAVITSVNNTGAGGSSGSTDTNWSIVYLGPPLTAEPTFVTSTSSVMFTGGSWVADSLPTYGWISPQQSYTSSADKDPAGNYTFTTTFSLSGLDPATANLQFVFAVDNSLTSVVLNSTTFAITGSNLTSLSATQTISTGFVAGINTLTFNVINNTGKATNPVGLLVDFTSATAAPGVPEPGTLGLVGIVLAGIAFVKKRGRSSPEPPQ